VASTPGKFPSTPEAGAGVGQIRSDGDRAVRRSEQPFPGAVPVPAGRQVQRQPAGRACEPAGDGDELGADRAGRGACVGGRGQATRRRVRLNAIAAQTSQALFGPEAPGRYL